MINDNYIQIGPNSMIEAGTKETKSKKKEDDVYEVLDSKENFEGDLQMLQEKMRFMIHESGMI